MDDNCSAEELVSRVKIILKNANFCHLGMCRSNMPYVVTVNFGYDDNYIYFHTSQKGKKNEIIKENPNVCFELNYGGEVYSNKNACNWGTKFRSLIGEGKAELIEDEVIKNNALAEIMKKYSGSKDHEFNEHVLSHTYVYRIRLNNATVSQNKMYW